jgi:enoyl-CoA hydratase/carnithine racemase
VKASETLFIMSLNRDRNYNCLDSSMIAALKDHIVFYDRNSTLKATVLRSFNNQVFSFGTDFKTLSGFIREGQLPAAEVYLAELSAFAEFMAGLNFPLLVELDGTLANSAAAIFTSLPFVFGTETTAIKFNEVDFQGCLLGGSSFHLARLPIGLGAYLALTGVSVSGRDLKDLGFVRDFARFETANIELFAKRAGRLSEVTSFSSSYEPLFGQRLSRKADTNLAIDELMERSKEESGRKVLFDLFYRKKLIEHANFTFRQDNTDPNNWERLENHPRKLVENHLLDFESHVLNEMELDPQPARSELTPALKAFAARHFTKSTVSEIIESLRVDSSELAAETLAILLSKNRFTLEVIFRTLREAESLTFSESLMLEYQVAAGVIASPQLAADAFTQAKLVGPFPAVSEEELEAAVGPVFAGRASRTRPSAPSFATVPEALLPTKLYYQDYPEAFRCYFNEQQLRNPALQPNFKRVVETQLLSLGLDFASPTFNKREALRKLWFRESLSRKIEKKREVMVELAADQNKQADYFEGRRQAIEQLCKGPDFVERVESALEAVFEEQKSKISQTIEGRFRSAQRLVRRRQIAALRDTLVVNRLATKTGEKADLSKFKELPIEISSTRFELSGDFKKQLGFDALRAQYESSVQVDNPQRLRAIYEGVMPVEEFIKVKKVSAEAHTVDYSEIFKAVGKYARQKLSQEDFERMAHYVYRRGYPASEVKFRNRFIDQVLKELERSGRELSEAERAQLVSFVNKDFFKAFESVLDLHKFLAQPQKDLFAFCSNLKSCEESFQLALTEKPIPETEKDEDFYKKAEELKAINKLNLKAEPPMTVGPSSKDLFALLLHSGVVQQNTVAALQGLASSQVPLLRELGEQLESIYRSKFLEICPSGQLSLGDPEAGALSRSFAKEAFDEFAALLAPHIFFRLSEAGIQRIGELHHQYLYAIQVGRQRTKSKELDDEFLQKMKLAGLQAASLESLKAELLEVDHVLNVLVELSWEFKSKVTFKEDVLDLTAQQARDLLVLKEGQLARLHKKNDFLPPTKSIQELTETKHEPLDPFFKPMGRQDISIIEKSKRKALDKAIEDPRLTLYKPLGDIRSKGNVKHNLELKLGELMLSENRLGLKKDEMGHLVRMPLPLPQNLENFRTSLESAFVETNVIRMLEAQKRGEFDSQAQKDQNGEKATTSAGSEAPVPEAAQKGGYLSNAGIPTPEQYRIVLRTVMKARRRELCSILSQPFLEDQAEHQSPKKTNLELYNTVFKNDFEEKLEQATKVHKRLLYVEQLEKREKMLSERPEKYRRSEAWEAAQERKKQELRRILKPTGQQLSPADLAFSAEMKKVYKEEVEEHNKKILAIMKACPGLQDFAGQIYDISQRRFKAYEEAYEEPEKKVEAEKSEGTEAAKTEKKVAPVPVVAPAAPAPLVSSTGLPQLSSRRTAFLKDNKAVFEKSLLSEDPDEVIRREAMRRKRTTFQQVVEQEMLEERMKSGEEPWSSRVEQQIFDELNDIKKIPRVNPLEGVLVEDTPNNRRLIRSYSETLKEFICETGEESLSLAPNDAPSLKHTLTKPQIKRLAETRGVYAQLLRESFMRVDRWDAAKMAPGMKQTKLELSGFERLGRLMHRTQLEHALVQSEKIATGLLFNALGPKADSDFYNGSRASFIRDFYGTGFVRRVVDVEKIPEELIEEGEGFRVTQDREARLTEAKQQLESAARSSHIWKEGVEMPLLRLEKLTHRFALGGRTAALAECYDKLSEEVARIPSHFTELDFRQPAEEWVEVQLFLYLEELFEHRRQSEASLLAPELELLDADLGRFLDRQAIREHLRARLAEDRHLLEAFAFVQHDSTAFLEEKFENSSRTSPEMLDYRRAIQNFDKMKRFASIAAYSNECLQMSGIELRSYIESLVNMGDELSKDQKARGLRSAVLPAQPSAPSPVLPTPKQAKLELNALDLFDTFVNGLQSKPALKTGQSKSILEDLSTKLKNMRTD